MYAKTEIKCPIGKLLCWVKIRLLFEKYLLMENTCAVWKDMFMESIFNVSENIFLLKNNNCGNWII